MIASETPAAERRTDDILPPDVQAGGVAQFAGYQRFPAFTWPWFVRRASLFWPFAILYGAFLAVWHSSSMTSWGDAVPLGVRAVGSAIASVSVGPLLATLVRYRRLPYVLEIALVLVAIGAGVIVAHVLDNLVGEYHRMLMGRLHGSGRSMHAPMAVSNVSQMIGELMGSIPHWLGLVLVGGGWELPSYFSERRRLTEHARRHDLERLRRDKADADMRLAVLQAQVEPHFLFNTLASIRSLVNAEPARAIQTINALSDYLRSTLPKLRRDVGQQSTTLGEQVDISALYLDLMKIRMGDRLSVTVDVSDDVRELAFPPLLMISLVENAVKHGVEPKAGPAAIVIRAQLHRHEQAARLQVDVVDDGVGLGEGMGAGVGLANIRAQLQHRFGDAAALTIEGLASGGVRARILIPAEVA
jgi:hypothetical protein